MKVRTKIKFIPENLPARVLDQTNTKVIGQMIAVEEIEQGFEAIIELTDKQFIDEYIQALKTRTSISSRANESSN